ncbi:3-dehydroquinate dehydratase [Pyrococcus abyssi]|uniref:3-dehydroquinate dehydratase n=1 Tax=Pyrococcus abyssi (strain GE5 / Orsay) TaxID=272844 RepID=AROD_PYRAB|nr:3-dehydroquinate dehydratase [Pyrococcus abyssi]Q9V1H8.1 RecName: Full=3-dehydroquinate dehydratase; Short=3-dehydroquinase; AltName: Full=Type I DHQase; AltName: Full=Type I dehydroquinase; Short=DHQ1 [Pyrococcus abyssi GE5]CAB49371.1 aroD 3-dehydroquinate dehydratase [Pyrococcus abyssi GE5]CCE69832.1 TPA: 3-dehydroquinate dehydratase [Pyrococcus abyssi GE5]
MIATVILADSIKEAIEKIKSSSSDLYELRADSLKDYSKLELLEPYSEKLVVTIRSKDEGGFKELSDEKRLELYSKFLEIKPRYVDVEFRSKIKDEVMEIAKRVGSRVILSYHNFRETPPFGVLYNLLEDMESEGADIVKIVTHASSPKDNIRIIRLYEFADNLIAFCMGSKGKISRIFSSMYSPITYVALDKKAAPGQLTLEELRVILKILGEGR